MDTPQDTPILRLQTFVVALLLFAIFGVLAFIMTSFGGPADPDPRAGLRIDARAAAEESSANVLEPIGWLRPDKDQLTAAAAVVGDRGEPAPTEFVVPGSPTAIKQAAAQPDEAAEEENGEETPEEPSEPTPSDESDESDESDPSDDSEAPEPPATDDATN